MDSWTEAFTCEARFDGHRNWYEVTRYGFVSAQGKRVTRRVSYLSPELARRIVPKLLDRHGIHGQDQAGLYHGRVFLLKRTGAI